VHSEDHIWEYGKPSLVAEGGPIAVIASGVMVRRALEAKKQLAEGGLSVRVVNLSSFTEVSVEALLALVKDAPFVVTVEDHSVSGGLGGLVAEILSERRPTPVYRIGLKNCFAESGFPDELFAKYQMDTNEICRVVKEHHRG
jgi:transketolase